jgi:hypothetical protein
MWRRIIPKQKTLPQETLASHSTAVGAEIEEIQAEAKATGTKQLANRPRSQQVMLQR